jgi:hypothetical protein
MNFPFHSGACSILLKKLHYGEYAMIMPLRFLAFFMTKRQISESG